MSYVVDGSQTIAHSPANPPSPPLPSRALLHCGSLSTLFIAAGLLPASALVEVYRPHYSAVLVPTLFIALAVAISVTSYALWYLWVEHRKSDQAFSAAACESTSMFHSVLDGILILDNQANCLDANPAAAAILRVSYDQLIGRNLGTFLRDPTLFVQEWQSFLRRNSQRGRAELVAGDGATVFADFSAAAHYLPGRHIIVLCDVTERIKTEKALRESEERFQYVADNIQEIIWTLNAETKEVVYVNHAYATVTGHSIETLHRNPFSYRELIHPQDRIRVLSKLNEVAASGTIDEEFRFVHADGSMRWIWVKAHPGKNGRGRWIVGTAQDITSRKEAERQIAEHLDATEAARAEAEALRKATLALSQNLAMDSVLDTLLRCIGELVPFDRACVLFVEDPAHLMVARETAQSEPSRAGLVLSALQNAFLRRILFDQTPIFLSDTAEESEWRGGPPFDGIRCWMGIPLTAGGAVIGILSLCALRPAAFTAEHLRLAKNLAMSAAVAIQNARVHERAAIYASELEARLRELHETQAALQHVRRSAMPL